MIGRASLQCAPWQPEVTGIGPETSGTSILKGGMTTKKKAISIAFFLDYFLDLCYSIIVTIYNYGVKHV